VIAAVAMCAILNVALVAMLVTGNAFVVTRRAHPRLYWMLFVGLVALNAAVAWTGVIAMRHAAISN
jgi:hypothetical protein